MINYCSDNRVHYMNTNNLDAIMAPTGSPAWKTDLLLGDHFVGGSSSLAAISGYPAIIVPMDFINDVPDGVTFFCRHRAKLFCWK
jgi:amidase